MYMPGRQVTSLNSPEPRWTTAENPPQDDNSIFRDPGRAREPAGRIPLYVWVIAAVLVAIPVGWAWGDGATRLELLPKLILRALTALAAPLVVLAILSAIVTNEIRGRLGALMMVFYLINTLVAMVIGLTLTNLIRPGVGASLSGPRPRRSRRSRNRSPTCSST